MGPAAVQGFGGTSTLKATDRPSFSAKGKTCFPLPLRLPAGPRRQLPASFLGTPEVTPALQAVPGAGGGVGGRAVNQKGSTMLSRPWGINTGASEHNRKTQKEPKGRRSPLCSCSSGERTVTPCPPCQIFTRMGQCYTFNSGAGGAEPLTTSKGGAGNGLDILLDVQQEEYLPVWKPTDDTPYEVGIRVQIHSQEEPPVIDQLGFGAAPGYQTFVSCQKQQLSFLPPPWGDCSSTSMDPDFEDPSDLLGPPSPSANPSPPYSLMGCRMACEARYVARKCGCRMMHMPGSAPVCSPQQYKDCADPALDAVVRKETCACPNPCALTRYAKELSMVRLPSRAAARYLARKFNRSEAYIGENVLALDIFFEALNYETVDQKKAYEMSELLGDIGGQMGLFIGASLLTILEILDFLCEVFQDRVLGYFWNRRRSQRHSSTNLLQEGQAGHGIHIPHLSLGHRPPTPSCTVTKTLSASQRTRYLVTRL